MVKVWSRGLARLGVFCKVSAVARQHIERGDPSELDKRPQGLAGAPLGREREAFEDIRSKLGDRGACARVDLAKHRPLRGRCFTELAPEAGARLNYRGGSTVREVGSGIGTRPGLGSDGWKSGPG